MNKIAAIIVTYHPEKERLLCLMEAISRQVSEVIVVDNSPSCKELPEMLSTYNCNTLYLEGNHGIASAQNIGIRKALELDCSDFLLLDQDSIPHEDMVPCLLSAREKALKNGIKVAAVGPQQIDMLRDSNVGEFVLYESSKIKLAKKPKSSNYNYCCPIFLIASGCLISRNVIEIVGYMDDELFIDCVDIEWGFRALERGYTCIGSFEAKMKHEIGEEPIKLLGKELTTHSPIRHYYFYRNFYLLCKRQYIPYYWKKHVVLKSTLQAIIFIFLGREKLLQAKMITKGIFHGLLGKAGKYE